MELITSSNSILDQYFKPDTMSIHIKEGVKMLKKESGPGNWQSVFDEKIMTKKEVEKLISKIFKEVESRDDSYMEIDRPMSKVLQLDKYRIVIAYPPLSDGLEMTVVKPIKKLSLDDYDLDDKVIDLFKNKSKGILVSGAPGSGKTTFSQALVEFFHEQDKIIKTVESPRDLIVPDNVVQYSFTHGSHDELRDILLLSRPDYTIYDEVRNTPDFELYKDLRLTGIGMIGVIHATKPVDSVQRFLGTIEIGIIPQVLDTVIFIEGGKITEILQLKLTVKVPAGMNSEDLSRPVIVISSFFQDKPLYEIYSFGEQVVVIPLEEIEAGMVDKKKKNIHKYAKNLIDQKLGLLVPGGFLSKIQSDDRIDIYVPTKNKASIIGKAGKNIMDIEKQMGFQIGVHTFDELPTLDVKVQIKKHNNQMVLLLPKHMIDTSIYVMIGDDILHGKTDETAKLTIKKKQLVKEIDRKGLVLIDYDAA